MTRRSPLAPQVGTLDEQGRRGFTGSSWVGLVAPARTPKPLVARMAAGLGADCAAAAAIHTRSAIEHGFCAVCGRTLRLNGRTTQSRRDHGRARSAPSCAGASHARRGARPRQASPRSRPAASPRAACRDAQRPRGCG
ncbi:hypothetical protein DFH01_20465 [Falsiroseomonas bella]|uniref:Uncharacterized protein n=1 Tax=Falsiroseomonas bella TaxID=2184016 RepID=A0A317FD27_9PROT|nr:hypothetical protein DFH01_20465 [Falsiroseomonas bella]